MIDPKEVVVDNIDPSEVKIDQPKQSTGKVLQDMGIGAGLGSVAGAGAAGLGLGIQALANNRNEIAGGLINSIIKPTHKNYMFGKNPGKGVAQEGIWGINLKDIGQKVDQRLSELNTYAKEYRSLYEHKGKVADFESSKVFDPLNKALDELGKAPETHSAKIKELEGVVNDLKGNLPEDFKSVPLETAYQAKDVIKNMQKWNVESSSDHIVNSALKQVYHNIDSAIDEVLPTLKPINSRMANLISAKQAIAHRAEILARRDPMDTLNLVNAIPHLVSNTATKSGLAKILSEKFGMVAKGGATALGVYPFISQALQGAADPDPINAMAASAVGGELAPAGSQERDIQLGRLL